MVLFPDNSFNEVTIARELTLPSHNFVAVLGDTIVGYVLARMDGQLMDITRLAVDRDHQAQGIGKKLLCTALARTRGQVMLNVAKTNRRALMLYKTHGFLIVGQVQQSWLMMTRKPQVESGIIEMEEPHGTRDSL